MRGTILHIAIFVAGLSLGSLAHYELSRPAKSLTESERATEQTWKVTYTEERTHERMLQFQRALEALKNAGVAKNAATLSKQIEAQQGIDDLLVKYREAAYAKYAPFIGTAGVLLAAILTMLATWHVAKRTPHDTPDH